MVLLQLFSIEEAILALIKMHKHLDKLRLSGEAICVMASKHQATQLLTDGQTI